MEKRYYWLKLNDDFFRDKPIKKLRSIAGGDTYTIIYLKMLLLAIKQENRLYYDGIEMSFTDEVALEIEEDPENVKMTIQYLLAKGLIEEISTEEMYLTQCEEMVGSETDAARRKRISRSRQRQRELEADVTKEVPKIEEVVEEEPKEPKKPKKETCLQIYDRIVGEYSLDIMVEEKMRQWMQYKIEINDGYKEQGLRALLKKVNKLQSQYDPQALCEVVDLSMENNWKGLFWNKINEKGRRQGGYVQKIENRVSDVDNW